MIRPKTLVRTFRQHVEGVHQGNRERLFIRRRRGCIGGEGITAVCESHDDGKCEAKVAKENHIASCCEIVVRVYTTKPSPTAGRRHAIRVLRRFAPPEAVSSSHV